MTITVIGSESFLARNFIKYIENSEFEAYGCSSDIDRSETIKFKLYDYVDVNESHNEKYDYHRVDFSDKKSVEMIDYSSDIVMIFIGRTGTVVSLKEYEEFICVNEIYFLNILDAFVRSGSKARIIYPSSRLVFKSCEERKIDEDSERGFKSVYAITKYASEKYLELFRSIYGIDYVILHICTPMGSLLDEYGNYGTFEIFVNQAKDDGQVTVFGSGLQRKTFTDILDICEAFRRLCLINQHTYYTYNLGGQELSLLDIAKKIASEYDVPIVFRDWPDLYEKVDGGTVVFDSKRFDKEFSFSYRDII